MAMQVNKGDVVRLDNPISTYRGKFSAGHIGVVTALPPFDNDYANLDDEVGAPFWNRTEGMTVLSGDLFENLFYDMANGDTLVATQDSSDGEVSKGTHYTAIMADCGCCFEFEDDNGETVDHMENNFYFVNLSAERRKSSTAEVIPFPTPVKVAPTPWADMDDTAKGMLLLAKHEGTPYQYYSPFSEKWFDDDDDFEGEFAYRIKPQALIDAENNVKALATNVVDFRTAFEKAESELSEAVAALDAAREEEAALKAA